MADLDSQQIAIESLARQQNNNAEVARKLGVSENTIGRFKSAHATEIQKQAEKYLATLPSIVDTDIIQIQTRSKLIAHIASPTDNPNSTKLTETQDILSFCKDTDKIITDVKRSIGMYSAHSPGLVFQQLNIYQSNQQVISPAVLGMLSGKIDNMVGEDDDNEGILEADVEG